MITAKWPGGTLFKAKDGSEVWACDCPAEAIFKTREGYVLVETKWFVNGKPVPKFTMPSELIKAMVQNGYLQDRNDARTSITRTARRVTKREAIRHILRGVLQDHHAEELVESLGLQEGAKSALVTITPHRSGRVLLTVSGELHDEIAALAKKKDITPQQALREVIALAEQKYARR